ncbi:hypothetical protein [Pedobacter polysacchareus]|uniref:hypothetical protein n=1 Tax=Pedobacter polysacchareus TaxID=2861973 RepID=UPI001C98E944|nr:hypothetical protein [Pedobacter polysacchareus]
MLEKLIGNDHSYNENSQLKKLVAELSLDKHPVCSLQKIDGLERKFNSLARCFADKVTLPMFAGCCGMVGDRGFLFPELTQSATFLEKTEVCSSSVFDGYYSSSKTCEMALSDAVSKNYYSILKLVDECTIP